MLPEHFGTHEHQLEVSESLPDLPCFHCVVCVQKLGRWFSLPKKNRPVLPYSAVVLLVLICMGLTLNW